MPTADQLATFIFGMAIGAVIGVVIYKLGRGDF